MNSVNKNKMCKIDFGYTKLVVYSGHKLKTHVSTENDKTDGK